MNEIKFEVRISYTVINHYWIEYAGITIRRVNDDRDIVTFNMGEPMTDHQLMIEFTNNLHNQIKAGGKARAKFDHDDTFDTWVTDMPQYSLNFNGLSPELILDNSNTDVPRINNQWN